ncbi:MAG: Zn-ribbon containing protein [Candidatus Pacearchaeota archaeon]
MAHRCVRCGKIYPSTAPEILKGCPCGSHYFFFFREDDLSMIEKIEKLTAKEREEIVKDVKALVGPDVEKPIVLNLESIRIRKPGKFELDLVSLFKRRPIIYKLEEGKYIIDIASTFQIRRKLLEPEAEAAIEAILEETESEQTKEQQELAKES